MSVRWCVLGEVAVHVDGRAIDLGHARQRCVLACLLVEVNRAVPVDELLERVWADRQPQRAFNVLSSYVSRLRRILGQVPEFALSRERTGYLLTVDPLAVDLHRFRDLVAKARDATADERRLELLEQAVALWRGDAFGTLDSPWLNTVRHSLHAERRAAELDRNDLALARGEHGRLLGELWARSAQHPMDERLAGQLMLALYRDGRQAEALHQYERLRTLLAEELGADPSPPVRRLHERILRAEPILAERPRAAPAAPASPVPRQLPASPPYFTGRKADVAALDATLDRAHPALVISGPPGVGKTALAVHWAHRVAEHFDGGQLYLNLRGFDPSDSPLVPADAQRSILLALGVLLHDLPQDQDAQAGLYRTLLAGKRILLVLDNARTEAQVRPLLPGTRGCLALVTSRNQLAGLVAADGAYPHALDLFTVPEARDMLSHRIGRDRVDTEPAAADQLINHCGRLPLGLAIVAARAAIHPTFSLADLATDLADAPDRLTSLANTDSVTDVRDVFSWSYHSLGDAAARLFRLLGLHPGPDFSVPAAANAAGLAIDSVRPLLAELVRANLLVESSLGRFAFHDLLWAYAIAQADSLDTETERHACRHRIVDHYTQTAQAAAMLISPTRDPLAALPPAPDASPEPLGDTERAMDWLTENHAVLLGVIDTAANHGFDRYVGHLAWALGGYLDRRGHWPEWAATQHKALHVAQRSADLAGRARAHRGIGAACLRLGRHDDARRHLDAALGVFGELEDFTGQAFTYFVLAQVSELQGRLAQALSETRRALDLHRHGGNQVGQANALNSIGWYQTHLGDHHEAIASCQEALRLFERLDDRDGQSATWDTLGRCHRNLGQYREAIECYRHALDLNQLAGGHRLLEASTLAQLGDTHAAAREAEEARRMWRRALAIYDDLGHPNAQRLREKIDSAILAPH
jgi:DNA-binding SARP family transcriptional activator/Tfp pilus assembly protein PilF